MGQKKKLKNLKYLLGSIPIDKNLSINQTMEFLLMIDIPDGEISKKYLSIAKNLNKSLKIKHSLKLVIFS